MNVEYYIAKRLFTANKTNNRYTRPILNIAILAVSISVAVMLLSVFVVTGFKDTISNKVTGFEGHIVISNFTLNESYESDPIKINPEFFQELKEDTDISFFSVFAKKAGIIKTKDEIEGVLLKGVDKKYNWSFIKNHLLEGSVPVFSDTLSNKIVISEELSRSLKLKIGDDVFVYFIQDPPRVRKLNISAIYNTSLSDFDNLFVFVDINHIRSLNNWKENEVGGMEIFIKNFDDLQKVNERIYNQIDYNLDAINIKDKYSQIFDWLDLQDVNVKVIIILMLIVGGINITTALLILILERINLIGVLKSIGSTDWTIRRIFLYNAMYITLKGLMFGNLFAIFLALLQKHFKIISLDPQTYYMNTVPVNIDIFNIIILNLGVLILCYLILIIPSFVITRISPIKAIRFQ